MWFDEDIEIIIGSDVFVNLSEVNEFSQIDIVKVDTNEDVIIVQTSEPVAPVQSVNGKIGWVTIDKSDVGLSNVENVSIINTSGYLQDQIDNFNSGDLSGIYYLNSNPSGFITGVNLSSYATVSNLALTGSNLQNQIDSLSDAVTSVNGQTGVVVLDSSDINYNKAYFSITGSHSLISGDFTLVQIDESNRFIYISVTDSSSIATWSTPNNRWELRAYQTNNDFTLLYFNSGASIYPPQTGWIANTGITEPTPIIVYDSLTAEDAFSVLITRLEGIINNTSPLIPQGGGGAVQNNFIQSPYILLNLTGGAVDGGIFFVTGSGLTGINDYGPIIGFDHSNKFKFGIARRSDDLSVLNDIAAVQDITNYSGFVNNNYYGINNPSGFITGVDLSSLYPRSNPSGYITGVNLSAYITTGQTGDFYPRSNPSGCITNGQTGDFYPRSNPSGYITGVNLSSYATITNLNSTGSNLQNQINSLSGSAVLIYGNQTIDGTKTFRNSVYIHDLYVTGTEFIANVENNFIESPYILLNLTGGAVDGGIFFVTGTGLTGVNDYGPIIGFDHTDKFKFGIARRSDDLSTLDSIAGISDITDYSGFANNNFYLKSNPSGFVTNTNLQELQISLSTGIENYTGTFVTPFSSVPSVVATMLATQGFNYMAALTSVTTTNFVADFSDVIEETGVTLNIIAYN